MASLLGKIASFARTPAGQRALRTATTKAQELARDPRTKDRVAQVRERLQGQVGSRTRDDGSPPTGGPAAGSTAADDERGRADGPPDRS